MKAKGHFEAANGVQLGQQGLLVRDLDVDIGSDRIGKARRFLDLSELHRRLGRKLLVELRVILELLDDGAHQRGHFRTLRLVGFDPLDFGNEVLALGTKLLQRRAPLPFHENADGAVRQLQELKNGRHHAHIVERVAIGIVLGRIELRDQEDALVRSHCAFERRHGFVAAHEERHDHLREDDDVPQGEDRKSFDHLNSRGRRQSASPPIW
jgi:hypothetical protein